MCVWAWVWERDSLLTALRSFSQTPTAPPSHPQCVCVCSHVCVWEDVTNAEEEGYVWRHLWCFSHQTLFFSWGGGGEGGGDLCHGVLFVFLSLLLPDLLISYIRHPNISSPHKDLLNLPSTSKANRVYVLWGRGRRMHAHIRNVNLSQEQHSFLGNAHRCSNL